MMTKSCHVQALNSTGTQTITVRTNTGSGWIWGLWWQPFLRQTGWTRQPAAVSSVRGFHQLPPLCLVMACLKVPLWPELCLLLFDPTWPHTAATFHLEVSTNAVVLRHAAAVVDDPTLIRTLVWRFDTGEAKLVWDVASSYFDHLKKK